MASGTLSATETSYWLKFFTDADIPAGDAAHYAVLFSDNRIQRGMLLDLTKEYLTDMGVSRLGDIISILKHAKTVYNQDAKDKALKGAKYSTATASPFRRSTAASRMVDHFLTKSPDSAPMNQLPTPKLSLNTNSGRKSSVFDRLGADSSGSGTGGSGGESVFSRLGGKSGQKRSASAPSPGDSGDDDDDDDGPQSPLGYYGILKFAAKKPTPNSTVPAKKLRITIEDPDSPVQITAVERPKVTSPSKVKVTGLDRVKVSVGGKGEGFDPSDIQPLKVQVSSTTSTPAAPQAKIQRRLRGTSVSSSVDDLLYSSRISAVQKDEVTTTTPPLTRTEGVLSLDATVTSSSIKTRLGPKVLKAPASSTTKGFGPTTKTATASNVKSRLGTRAAQPAASTKPSIKIASKIRSEQVVKMPTAAKMRSEQEMKLPARTKLIVTASVQPKTRPSTGVFSRLGKKNSVL